MSSSTPTVVVVGGGVAGLATAWLLRELGNEAGQKVNLQVFEAESEPGGSTRTDLIQDFTCDWGPNGFLDNEPATLDLVERLGLTSELVEANASASRRFVYYGGKMRELPTGPKSFFTSDVVSFRAKLRIATEIFVSAKKDESDETVYDFGRRRLGKEFADYLLDPMVSGIYAGNTHELSLAAVFPKMVEMEKQYGSLFKALLAKRKEAKRTGKKSGGPAGAAATLHTFRTGMGELTWTLAQNLSAELKTSAPVLGVERSSDRFSVRLEGQEVLTDAVVLACPSYEAGDIIAGLSLQAGVQISQIQYAPVDVVCHGHETRDVDHDLNGFGVLIPRCEGIRSLGSLWCNSIFPGQAPEDYVLLRTIIGGAHDQELEKLSEVELETVAQRDHRLLFGVHKEPAFRRVFRHPKGIAQYTMGHLDRVAASEQLEKELPGLYFTGASYRGVSVNGCAKDAFLTARRFWQYWREKS